MRNMRARCCVKAVGLNGIRLLTYGRGAGHGFYFMIYVGAQFPVALALGNSAFAIFSKPGFITVSL